MINRTFSLICLALLGLLSIGCGEGSAPSSTGTAGPSSYPYTAATTIGMVHDIVKEVAGEHANVKGIIGSGVDPHLYKPTAGDVREMISADVVFYSGLMLEGKMADTLVKVARTKPVFPVTELIPESYLLEPEEFAGHFDPHVWMDVKGWMQAVDAVAKSLSEFDPAHASDYRANGEQYKAQLEALDAYARKVIASIPQEQRVLVTAHDAFNYFGRAYDIEVRGIQGLSTESEAGVEDINQLVQFLVDRNIGAVFVESSVSDKNVRALIEGAQARGHNVIIGGKLFSDAMGEPGSYEGTYIGMIDHNATIIARALGGDAPQRGLNGKLKDVSNE